VVAVSVACHPDGLNFHSCDSNLSYSVDWTNYDLILNHNEPRICPVQLAYPKQTFPMSATIVDNGQVRSFSSANLQIFTSDLALLDNQYDYFEIDVQGNWSVTHNAIYDQGTGSNPCYDQMHYGMSSRYPGNPGSLPYADGYLTYAYDPPYPPCGGGGVI